MRVLAAVILVALEACSSTECDVIDYTPHVSPADTGDQEYVDYMYSTNEYPTAVGGVQHYSVKIDLCDGPTPVMAASVTDGHPEIATVQTDGASFDVHGVAPGDPQLVVQGDGKMAYYPMPFYVEPIDHVRLVAGDFGAPDAFYRGADGVKILLDGGGLPVVDHDLTVSGPFAQGTHWNDLLLGDAAAGTYALTVHAGGADWPATAQIVDHIDDIAPEHASYTAAANASVNVCFFAHAGGLVVGGVSWQIDFDPRDGGAAQPNCMQAWVGNDHRLVQTITAHALGLTATATVTFTE